MSDCQFATMRFKISVIMPSYLGNYDGAAKNREQKFVRAVNSFLSQSYPNKELIIISDGCDKTVEIVSKSYQHDCISILHLPKQPPFSGNVREMGLRNAIGNFICYLDTDDYFSQSNHLSSIVSGMQNGNDLVYFDDDVRWNEHVSSKRNVTLQKGCIGTSNIAHINSDDISWFRMDGYGHDWTFISKLLEKKSPIKIEGTSYTVCHIPNVVDV